MINYATCCLKLENLIEGLSVLKECISIILESDW